MDTQLTVEYLGQGSVAISYFGSEIVTDPWFSGAAHLGSWMPHPMLPAPGLDALRARVDLATHIYLSSDSTHHYDPDFLLGLEYKLIVTGLYNNARYRASLKPLKEKHRLRFVRNRHRIELDDEDFTLQLFHHQPGFRTGAVMRIETPEGAIVFAGDAPLSPGQLRAVARVGPTTMFLASLNLANSVGALANRDFMVTGFQRALKILKPKTAWAIGGPMQFADPINADLNANAELLDWSAMVNDIARKTPLVWPAPGSELDIAGGEIEWEEIKGWQGWRACAPSPHAANSPSSDSPAETDLLVAAEAFVTARSGLLQGSQQHMEVPLLLSAVTSLDNLDSDQLEWTLRIDLDPGSSGAEFVDATSTDPPYQRITAPGNLLFGLLTGEIPYSELLASRLIRVERAPGPRNGILDLILKYGHDKPAAAALTRWLDAKRRCTETIARDHDGKTIELPKFCPHEGQPLEAARIENGRLICQGHDWEFDLDSGDCLVGDAAINLHSLMPGAPLPE
jgi:UDP-MurNAc hydroxylase